MDIAIIGISGRFPEAEDMHAFYDNLKAGRDSVRALSEERMKRTSVTAGNNYQLMGYLDGIDLFDYAFFGISLGEAMNMDPHQRLALELVYEVFENAGYDPFSFAGSETAVYMADNVLEYYELAREYDPTLMTGNLNSVVAGRVARFFDLRGGAMMIDTSCSSSLVAVHHACIGLESGEANQAVVCGIKVRLYPGLKTGLPSIGIGSPDGKTRSYSAGANGTGTGEAGGCILLKPLEKAIADKDIIHAIIKGSAVNQDAALSGSLTAPSSTAQARVITKAWLKAGIDPGTITFIEGHGTATKLGDPIEVEGIDLAFSLYTDRRNFCALSSLKSNIGHTDTAAGITGLIKTILSLKFKKLFPAVHFDKPNPFISFDRSHVFVNTVFRDWDPAPATVRRAGVNSFGLSGTNCHVVLEEAPLPLIEDRTCPKRFYPIPVSGLTRESLVSNVRKLKTFLENQRDNIHAPTLEEVSYTLCEGRPHFPFRYIGLADSLLSFSEQADKMPAEGSRKKKRDKLYFIFSHNDRIDDALIGELSDSCPEFLEHVRSLENLTEDIDMANREALRIFSFQYAFFQLLAERNLSTKYLIGEGVGDITISAITGAISAREAAVRAASYRELPSPDLMGKCGRFVRDNREDGLVMVELGPVSRISKVISSLAQDDDIEIAGVEPGESDILLGLMSRLYLANFAVDWQPFFAGRKISRQELPVYAFDRKRCWIREIEEEMCSVADQPERNSFPDEMEPAGVRPYDLEGVKAIVAQVWREVLKNDDIEDDDDFFEIGGHSLNGTQVLNRLNGLLGLALEMDDLFDHGTINELSVHMLDLFDKDKPDDVSDDIAATEIQANYPLTHTQKRFWVMDQIDHEMTAYNMPAAYSIHGELDIVAFVEAFRRLVERHEVLRTTFVLADGEPRQKVGDGLNFRVEYTDLRAVEGNEEAAMAEVKRKAAEPFDLSAGPLIKASLYRLAENEFLFFYSVHHIVADGWSMEILVRDVLALYQNSCNPETPKLPPLKIQYKDYTVWLDRQLNGEKLSIHKQYWLDEFRDIPPPLLFKTDFNRPARQSFKGDKINIVLDAHIKGAVARVSAKNGCTPFMTVLACINILLCKVTRQYDMVIGTPVSGRTQVELEDLIGLFLNTLPLRLPLRPDRKIADILQTVKAKVLRGNQHQLYPLDRLLEDIHYEGGPGRNALFDVGFTYNTFNAVAMSDENDRQAAMLTVQPVTHGFGSVKADWWFHLVDAYDRLLITLDFNTDLYLPSTAKRLLGDLEWLVRRVVVSPDLTLGQLIEEMDKNDGEEKLNSQAGLKRKNLELLRNIGRHGRQDSIEVINK